MDFNFDRIIDGQDKRDKREDWVGVIIHHTGIGDRKEIEDNDLLWDKLYHNTADWLGRKDDAYVSTHYLIGRKGQVTQIVNPQTHVAYHAGVSSFWHPQKNCFVKGCNDYFIGIELLGDGNKQGYHLEQYVSLAMLVNWLRIQFPPLHPQCFLGHQQVAPERKSDPGHLFDWDCFYSYLYFRVI